MPLRFEYRTQSTVPIEVERLIPSALREKSLAEIERLPLWHGNGQLPLAEFFHITGSAADNCLDFAGDLSSVHRLATGMTEGCVRIEGSIGRHLGAEMQGGCIDVMGDAGDWLGAEMHGGLIRLRGNAGDLVGAAYRGSPRGMAGGTILIEGNAGQEVAHSMRRGLIAIGGSSGEFAATNMIAGSLLVFGPCGARPAAGMRRGTLALFGKPAPDLLVTFRAGSICRPQFMRLYLRWLAEYGFPDAERWLDADYRMYHGDQLAVGRGEILVPQ
jgi:formylmethanofuran dehydrogenase subunit C